MKLNGKKILVTGAAGMVGRELIRQLDKFDCDITAVDLSWKNGLVAGEKVKHITADLRHLDVCTEITKNIDVALHCAGIKGSPEACKKNPADFFVPMVLFNTAFLEACRINSVSRCVYTSSVGVYSPAEIFEEHSVWEGFPSENDWFGGWAKRVGELQVEAYKKQFSENIFSVVRPANVYGRFDNFSDNGAMVIPSLIKRAANAQYNGVLEVYGDGSPIRDFIHASDVASGILHTILNDIFETINLGSGSGLSIAQIVDAVLSASNKNLSVKWLPTEFSGDKRRILSPEKASYFGFESQTNIYKGIEDTFQWYVDNVDIAENRFSAFS